MVPNREKPKEMRIGEGGELSKHLREKGGQRETARTRDSPGILK